MKLIVTLVSLTAFLVACASTTATRTEVSSDPSDRPTVVSEDPKPEPTRKDPFLDKIERFEGAYGEMACKANSNYDPNGALGTIRCPYEKLLELNVEKGLTFGVYLRILQKYGFESVEEYTKARDYIELARPGWFEQLRKQLLTFVEACPRN